MSIEVLKHFLEKNNIKFDNIVALSGDISTRKYFEVSLNKEVKIACLNEKENKKHNELYYYWYNQYIAGSISVPKIFHFEDGFNIQEKIYETIFDKVMRQPECISFVYDKCLDDLLKIHSLEIDVDKTYEKLNLERFRNEFALSNKAFNFESYGKVLDSLVLQNLSMDHQVICHRDYHSRNILIENDEQYIIDFQDSMLGNGIYDLVSILNDCYIQLPSEIITKIKKSYFLKAKTHKDEKKFLEQFDLYTIQRMYKAFGNFKTFYMRNNDPYYLKFIKPNAEKILSIIKSNKELIDLEPIFKRLRDEY